MPCDVSAIFVADFGACFVCLKFAPSNTYNFFDTFPSFSISNFHVFQVIHISLFFCEFTAFLGMNAEGKEKTNGEVETATG